MNTYPPGFANFPIEFADDLPADQRECTDCGQLKAIGAFYSRMRVTKNGSHEQWSSRCRQCTIRAINESKARRLKMMDAGIPKLVRQNAILWPRTPPNSPA